MASMPLALFPADGDPPRSIRALADQVSADGGAALAAYQESVGKNWQIFAILRHRPEKLIQNLEDFDADSIRRYEVARAGAMVAAAAKGS